MDPADTIIAKFGSQAELARLLGKRQSTVQHWSHTGFIPAKWHAPIMALATKYGIELNASNFVQQHEVNEIAQTAKRPVALWPGHLQFSAGPLLCYVLDDGRRVITQRAAALVLAGSNVTRGGGNLDSYLGVSALRGYVPKDLGDQLIEFDVPGLPRPAHGMSAETFLEICRAYTRARDDNALKTQRQVEIAIQAGMFLAACAKVGLIALIDEATGYQYERPDDALRVKLALFLEDEMRKWEKTFPDELWREFGRLTNWTGTIHERPKYWGKLVMELIYGYLDKDVANWLREHAPAPRKGQNYHQWLSGQYGLKKLIEHIWLVIGMGSACYSMSELRERMAERFGREMVQLRLPLPPPNRTLPVTKKTRRPRPHDVPD